MLTKASNIDEYIAGFPPDTRTALEQVRATIRKVAPEAEETISYAMPAFRLHKQVLVYFAGYQHHIGFYALPSGTAALQEEFSRYKMGKGSIQFPLKDPMPLDLIARIVEFRVNETLEKAAMKKKK